MSKLLRLFVVFFGILFIINSCDTPPSGTNPESESSLAKQFFSYSDSTNSLLTTAVDTLRQRNEGNNFIADFIKERGYPEWDAASAFYQNGLPIMLVPVRRPVQKKVSGLVYLTMNDGQPVYRWLPRDTEMNGVGLLTTESLEIFMLMYEQKIFGEVQAEDVNVEVKERKSFIDSDKTEKASDLIIEATNCGKVDVGDDGTWTKWYCDYSFYWTRAIDSGGGGGGGFGGGPGGGGEIPGGGGTPLTEEEKAAAELEALLEQNETALLDIPCDEIENWAGVAQHEVPESVMERLEITDELSGSFIQKLKDAKGPVVNMDKFSVTVSGNEIPNNWSASEYLNHIRTNINQYSSWVDFEFYPGLPNEQILWESDNPEGTLFSIQLNSLIPWIDDGSVVTSGYESSNWTFTTVYTPEDRWHPVSGNRKFGYSNNGDGTYTFYTQGVDRISTPKHQALQDVTGIPFAKADDLWSSFQELINDDFQNATIHKPVTWRPDYDKIEAVLNNNADPSILGCK